jgi:hypothetical protein
MLVRMNRKRIVRRGKSRRRVNRRAIYKAADRKRTMGARGRLLAYLRKRRIFVFVGNRICDRVKYPIRG